MHQVSRHYNSVIVWETCLGILNKTAFFFVILDSKYSKMTPKICKAEVTLTPFINKICKPWMLNKNANSENNKKNGLVLLCL